MSVARNGRELYCRAMPELAEVEYFREQWQCGLKQKVLAVELRASARIFRDADAEALRKTLTGAVYGAPRPLRAHGPHRQVYSGFF